MANNRRHDNSLLFTVRLWVERPTMDHAEVRGKVQHVLSGDGAYFRTWEDLSAFLAAMQHELDDAITIKEAERMEWTKGFYTRQYELLGSPSVWATFSPDNLPDRAKGRAAAVERLAGPSAKRVLELGCGGGIMAGAIALQGNRVVAVDIVDAAVASARRFAALLQPGALEVVQGDFYAIELSETFDVICYFDGFGIGTDADQRRLLRRIAGWLRPEGCALIDVYVPWHHVNDSGEAYQEGNVLYRSDFDADGCRLEESMWLVGEDESQAVTQSLRCYAPADFRLLLEGTGLTLHALESYASTWDYETPVPVQKAAVFLAMLVHEDDGCRLS